jgi:hypothetical protein
MLTPKDKWGSFGSKIETAAKAYRGDLIFFTIALFRGFSLGGYVVYMK